VRVGLLLRVRDRSVVLDQGFALIDEEFVLAIRAQELDAGVAQVLVMDVEFLVAFGTAGIEMLDHLRLLIDVLIGSLAIVIGQEGRAGEDAFSVRQGCGICSKKCPSGNVRKKVS
jgi:hypothetical protein